MPRGIPNPAAMYGISPRAWGFEVSIVRNGTRYYKQFGRASYGSEEQALLQAQDWRDGVVRSVPPVLRRTRAEKLRVNNTTGVSGVFCQVASSGKIRAWVAKTYIGQDEILRTDFPVDAMGHAAQALAIEERARQLERMAGLSRLHPAEEAIRTAPAACPAEPRSPKRSKSEIRRCTNSSGVSGVHFKSPNVGHPGYWLAITYTAGKGSVSKAFSIKEHGPDTAKRLAIAERERQLERKLNATDVSTLSPRQEVRQQHATTSEARQDL
ncbi:AP2 domain-containing protein [Variovorax sp. PAMC26660]|uniref:AP2 domain-containing protein n=1 Tax=Variovorax sp. PAMC26660 TaxID=2762322 RepID=UPI00164DB4FC|nr:AP2 domain-containing protein [Variovorax sp. PAMC26660]QNK69548.1 AP2 domain-containing protein [Variovorax sp. PAMC26660]